MGSLTTWLAAITWPLVSRVLAALGVGFVTYEGADLAIDSALASAQTAFSGLGVELAQLLARAGFFDAIAITTGALVSALVFTTMKRFALGAVGA